MKFSDLKVADHYRGLANEELKQFDLAIDDLITSETLLASNNRKSWVKEYLAKIPVQLSRVYRKKQDNEKAIAYADKAVQADHEGIEALKWRTFLKEDVGDYIGASEDLNEALKRRPADKTLTKMRGQLTYMIIENKREAASR